VSFRESHVCNSGTSPAVAKRNPSRSDLIFADGGKANHRTLTASTIDASNLAAEYCTFNAKMLSDPSSEFGETTEDTKRDISAFLAA